MPRLSAFHGIGIHMFWSEAEHQVAHFHAAAGGLRASVALDGSIVAGHLEPRTYGLVVEWSALHLDALQTDWDMARRKEPLVAITLLSYDQSMSGSPLPSVVGVAVLGDHVLRLLFDDGVVGDVAFSLGDLYGVLEPLRDPAYFATVRIDPELGTITWPNGEDWAPEALYESARARALTASQRFLANKQ